MPRKSQGLTEKITFNLRPVEREILDAYCEQEGVDMSEVLRAHIRSLKRKLKKVENQSEKKHES